MALVGLMICAGPLAGAEPEAKADSAKGQSIANRVCAACHGADGNSPTPANPKLASQNSGIYPEATEQLQVRGRKEGRAGEPRHGRNGRGLSTEDIRDVAAYYASQPEDRRGKTSGDPGSRSKNLARR